MPGESFVDGQQLTLVASVGGRSFTGCEASGKYLQYQSKVEIFSCDFLGRNLFVPNKLTMSRPY